MHLPLPSQDSRLVRQPSTDDPTAHDLQPAWCRLGSALKQGAVESPSKPLIQATGGGEGKVDLDPVVDVIHGDCGCGFKGIIDLGCQVGDNTLMGEEPSSSHGNKQFSAFFAFF